MMHTTAARYIASRDHEGELALPGAGPVLRLEQPDGTELAVIARGDGFDVFHGRKRMTTFSLSPRTAVRLGWWLVWWWVRHAWCGLRMRAWRWATVPASPRRGPP